MSHEPGPKAGCPGRHAWKQLSRRQFVSGILVGAAAGCASRTGMVPSDGGMGVLDAVAPPPDTSAVKKTAADQVVLGATGIRVSRLAMGSGTHGSGGTSDQTRLGVDGFSRLLVQSYHEQGLTFWETADQYGAHPHLKEAIRQVGRDKVVILTKTHAQTAARRRPIWIASGPSWASSRSTSCCCTPSRAATGRSSARAPWRLWPRPSRAASSARTERPVTPCRRCGWPPARPWVDVDLARINPARIQMDADPATVIGVLREMKAAGKGVVGMKILGVGELANRMDTAIAHAVQLDAIDAFTIGFTSNTQLEQVTQKIAAV